MCKEIELSDGKYAIIDDEDFELVTNSGYKWYHHAANDQRRNVSYAMGYRSSDNHYILMHRLIMGAEGNKLSIDHIDMNGLNNKRSNLRFANNSQQMANMKLRKDNHSGYKGVHRDKYRNRWRARISINKKNINIGSFRTAKDAAKAYNQKAIELFGEFARINEI